MRGTVKGLRIAAAGSQSCVVEVTGDGWEWAGTVPVERAPRIGQEVDLVAIGMPGGFDIPPAEPTGESPESFTFDEVFLLVREGWHYPLDDTKENRAAVLKSLHEIRDGGGSARYLDEEI